jgi:CheY-like chemotaxis protein
MSSTTPEMPTDTSSESDRDEERGRLQVLVIDDQADVREAMAEMLEQIGYRTVALASGPAALDHAVSGRAVDAAVIDFLMPGMTGTELVLALRQLQPELAILLVSGHPELGSASAPIARVHLLRKPFRMAQLDDALHQALALVASPALH